MVILQIVITKQPFYNNIDTLHVYSETTSMLNVKNMRLLYIQYTAPLHILWYQGLVYKSLLSKTQKITISF